MAPGSFTVALISVSVQSAYSLSNGLRGPPQDLASGIAESSAAQQALNDTAKDGAITTQGQWGHVANRIAERVAERWANRWAMSCGVYGCGGDMVWGQGCQCSPDCTLWGSCCPDYQPVCSAGGAPRPAPVGLGPAPDGPPSVSGGSSRNSCASSGCGRYHKGRSCQCTSECSRYGNCCDDYAQQCGAKEDSCASSGCGRYEPKRSCQCNPECERFGSCCKDYKKQCAAKASPAPAPGPAPGGGAGQDGQVLTVYHQTSPELGALILKTGFKPGSAGWCGGAIYFAKTRKATYTKAIGVDSHKGFMIEARVDLGRVLRLDSKCSGFERVSEGYDTIIFNPGDGDEIVVYNKDRILSTKSTSM